MILTDSLSCSACHPTGSRLDPLQYPGKFNKMNAIFFWDSGEDPGFYNWGGGAGFGKGGGGAGCMLNHVWCAVGRLPPKRPHWIRPWDSNVPCIDH